MISLSGNHSSSAENSKQGQRRLEVMGMSFKFNTNSQQMRSRLVSIKKSQCLLTFGKLTQLYTEILSPLSNFVFVGKMCLHKGNAIYARMQATDHHLPEAVFVLIVGRAILGKTHTRVLYAFG